MRWTGLSLTPPLLCSLLAGCHGLLGLEGGAAGGHAERPALADSRLADASQPVPADARLADASQPLPADARLADVPQPLPADAKLADLKKPAPDAKLADLTKPLPDAASTCPGAAPAVVLDKINPPAC